MNYNFSVEEAQILDDNDPLSSMRDFFHIPKYNGKDAIYFMGNSLGLQPKKFNKYLNNEIEDWKLMGVDAHFHARTPWFNYHMSLKQDTASLVGAKSHEVTNMNGLSVNLHLLLTTFYNPTSTRYKILCEPNLFPSDLYVIQSQIELRGFKPSDAIVYLPVNNDGVVEEEKLYDLIQENASELALVFIGGVNYYTGQVFDLKHIVKCAHRHNIVVGFDLAHAVGNVNLELHNWGVDFAAWCSYKYLNSGPGNISGVFIHEKQIKKKPFRLSAWWGHEDSTRFQIKDNFHPIMSADGWQLSNPPIFGMSVYRYSLELFNQIGMNNLIIKRNKLTSYLEGVIVAFNNLSNNLKFKLITPGKPEKRGSQLSLNLNKDSKELYSKLRKEGVYIDWRDPNVIRLAPVPMYNSFLDIARFYQILLKCI